MIGMGDAIPLIRYAKYLPDGLVCKVYNSVDQRQRLARSSNLLLPCADPGYAAQAWHLLAKADTAGIAGDAYELPDQDPSRRSE